jgi:hypothetical protein
MEVNEIIVGQTYECRDKLYRKVLEVGVGIYHFAPNEIYVKYEIVGKQGEWYKNRQHFLLTIGK